MTDVILRISGMDCGACAVRIVRALRGLPGVHAVSVSDTAGCARLTYDEAAVGLGEIARCVQRAGFDVPVETAELRCPGADDGAEARLRAVFGVRSAARAGDTFMVTLWPVGTDAAALPAVLGPGAELTAQRGGEEAQQGRTRQRLARRLGFGVLLTALMLWRPPELVQLALAAAVLFGAARGACCAAAVSGRTYPVCSQRLSCLRTVPMRPSRACGRAFPRRAAERGELLTHGAEASAARTARTVRRCIWLLLAYHAVCLPLAACGVIGPAAAAVLACGASGGVLLCALRGNETKEERP